MKIKIQGTIVPGHGVASGKGNDPRYPQGTLAMQQPHFAERGLDIDQFHRGTVNVDISPACFTIKKGKYFFENIDWSAHIPPENFYFFDVTLIYEDQPYEGLIYMPDPATKTDHMQNPSVLEVMLFSKVPNLVYGKLVFLEVDDEQLTID